LEREAIMLLRFRDWDMRAGHIVYTEETYLVVYVELGVAFHD